MAVCAKAPLKRGYMQRSIMLAGVALAFVSLSANAGSFPNPPLYPSFNASRATITKITVANSKYTLPVGINDDGTIAGQYRDAKNVYHGFIRAAGGALTTFSIGH